MRYQAVEMPIDRIQTTLANDMNSLNGSAILLRHAGFSGRARPAKVFPARFPALRALRTHESQRSQPRQVVGRHRQREQL
ncbi:hypothetical protein, partial [Burkholderia cepacia]|uniref:hypothetical protein n=1 Tax=Burkholderia cepacia TaxID=292 RepID=UPI001C6118F5